MKIAIGGKGGVGKTILAALLSQAFAESGYSVIAIDADPDGNLATVLNFPHPEKITPISEMADLIEERTGAKPGGYGAFFKLNPRVDDISEKFDGFKQQIDQTGICSETIISDIKRIRAALLEYASLIDSITTEDVELYFSFIDPVLEAYNNNPDSRDMGKLWVASNKKDWQKTLDGKWWLFEQSMTTDAF